MIHTLKVSEFGMKSRKLMTSIDTENFICHRKDMEMRGIPNERRTFGGKRRTIM